MTQNCDQIKTCKYPLKGDRCAGCKIHTAFRKQMAESEKQDKARAEEIYNENWSELEKRRGRV